jgi:hypothetical protein
MVKLIPYTSPFGVEKDNIGREKTDFWNVDSE